MSARSIAELLRVKELPWYPMKQGNNKKNREMLVQFVRWSFDNIIISLLRNSFYVTETQHDPSSVTYYLKTTWWNIESEGLQNLCKEEYDLVLPPSRTTAPSRLNQSDSLDVVATSLRHPVFPPLRFVPKKKSVRPISNLSLIVQQPGSTKPTSINRTLNDTYQACKSFSIENPWINGCGVHGLDGVYYRVVPFLRRVRQRRSGGEHVCMYIAKTDVAKCFDSIRTDLLMSIVETLFRSKQHSSVVRQFYGGGGGGGGGAKREGWEGEGEGEEEERDGVRVDHLGRKEAGGGRKRKRGNESGGEEKDTEFGGGGPALSLPVSLVGDDEEDDEDDEPYVVRKYSLVMADNTRSTKVRARYENHAALESNCQTSFVNFAKQQSDTTRNAIFSDHVHVNDIHPTKILNGLRQHLFDHRVSISPNRIYRQRNGIPQGSVMSTWLCNVYYGHMERWLARSRRLPLTIHQLAPETNTVEREDTSSSFPSAATTTATTTTTTTTTVAVRCTDDMLVLSTSEDDARHFVQTMIAGVPEYNCCVAVDKTQTNFILHKQTSKETTTNFMDEGDQCMNDVSTTTLLHRHINYCGLIIDCDTGNISADYSRYYGKHVRNLVTLPPVINGHDLKRLTLGFLKPRSHALLFDTSINTIEHVQFNVYEIGVLAAMKFHVHVLHMKQDARQNPSFFIDTIIDTADYMCWLVRDRTNNRKFPHCLCGLESTTVRSTILQSFVHVLSRKKSRYEEVLIGLKKLNIFRGCSRGGVMMMMMDDGGKEKEKDQKDGGIFEILF